MDHATTDKIRQALQRLRDQQAKRTGADRFSGDKGEHAKLSRSHAIQWTRRASARCSGGRV